MMKMILVIALVALFYGCSSQPTLQHAGDIEVSRETPDEDCKFISFVEGRTITSSGTLEQALENMKSDAANKGANYVKIETQSAMGGAVRGRAYLCN